jgi:hypothetical protein
MREARADAEASTTRPRWATKRDQVTGWTSWGSSSVWTVAPAGAGDCNLIVGRKK